MEECFRCHFPETKVLLFEAVLPDGIVKICNSCASDEGILLMHNDSFDKAEKRETVRERLSKISGVYIDKNTFFKVKEKNELKDLVNENYSFRENLELKRELIHNFHWVVLRGRRLKHLTQEQLAENIHEPEVLIKKIEKGFAPENLFVIKKIEKTLGIQLMENDNEEKLDYDTEKGIDVRDFDNLTIADLQEMKKKREEEMA